LPLLQFVQARAPLFGIWLDVCDCCWAEPSVIMLVSMPPIRRLFVAVSDPLEIVGLSDMKAGVLRTQLEQ